MKYSRILSLCLAALLLLAGCQQGGISQGQEEKLNIVAATYPVYLAAQSVTEGAEHIALTRLHTEGLSCLHDYTLSVMDMKQLEEADMVLLSGAGLDDFMEDTLAQISGILVDCAQGVELLPYFGHHHQEDEEEEDHWDPHYWMDPHNMIQVVGNIEEALSSLDPEWQEQYENNRERAIHQLKEKDGLLRGYLRESGQHIKGLITFHDGFQYFAHTYDLPLLASIEEEEGREASAKEINQIIDLIETHQLPIIFTERSGAEATAQAIARETGCQVGQLTLLMDGPESGGVSSYLDGITENLITIANGFWEKEVQEGQ